MKKIAQFLQLAVLVFFLGFLLFFYSFDTLGPAFGMDPLTPESMSSVFLTGFLLSLAAVGASLMATNRMRSEANKMQAEMNGLKAKLYDLEHSKVTEQTKAIPQKTQEEPSGLLRPRQNFTDQ